MPTYNMHFRPYDPPQLAPAYLCKECGHEHAITASKRGVLPAQTFIEECPRTGKKRRYLTSESYMGRPGAPMQWK